VLELELSLHELRDYLAERGLQVGGSGLCRVFKRHGITRKKTPATPPNAIRPTSRLRARAPVHSELGR